VSATTGRRATSQTTRSRETPTTTKTLTTTTSLRSPPNLTLKIYGTKLPQSKTTPKMSLLTSIEAPTVNQV